MRKFLKTIRKKSDTCFPLTNLDIRMESAYSFSPYVQNAQLLVADRVPQWVSRRTFYMSDRLAWISLLTKTAISPKSVFWMDPMARQKLPTEKFTSRKTDFWRLCCKSNLRTFGKYVAKTIYVLRPESFCA